MVIHGQQRVDERLLAFLLVVAPDDLWSEGNLAEEGEGEEHADDPAVDEKRGDRVERCVGGQDDSQPERQERERRLTACGNAGRWPRRRPGSR